MIIFNETKYPLATAYYNFETTYEASCYGLAVILLENEPCRKDPDLHRDHCEDLARMLLKTVLEFFNTPDKGSEA